MSSKKTHIVMQYLNAHTFYFLGSSEGGGTPAGSDEGEVLLPHCV